MSPGSNDPRTLEAWIKARFSRVLKNAPELSEQKHAELLALAKKAMNESLVSKSASESTGFVARVRDWIMRFKWLMVPTLASATYYAINRDQFHHSASPQSTDSGSPTAEESTTSSTRPSRAAQGTPAQAKPGSTNSNAESSTVVEPVTPNADESSTPGNLEKSNLNSHSKRLNEPNSAPTAAARGASPSLGSGAQLRDPLTSPQAEASSSPDEINASLAQPVFLAFRAAPANGPTAIELSWKLSRAAPDGASIAIEEQIGDDPVVKLISGPSATQSSAVLNLTQIDKTHTFRASVVFDGTHSGYSNSIKVLMTDTTLPAPIGFRSHPLRGSTGTANFVSTKEPEYVLFMWQPASSAAEQSTAYYKFSLIYADGHAEVSSVPTDSPRIVVKLPAGQACLWAEISAVQANGTVSSKLKGGFTLGDTNSNGSVTTEDEKTVQDSSDFNTGKSKPYTADAKWATIEAIANPADVNGDSFVDQNDLKMVQKYRDQKLICPQP